MPRTSPAAALPRHADDNVSDELRHKSVTGLAGARYSFEDKGCVSVGVLLSAIERGGDFAEWVQLSAGLDQDGYQNGTLIARWRGNAFADFEYEVLDMLTLTVTASEFLLQGFNKCARNAVRMESWTWETAIEGRVEQWLHGFVRFEVIGGRRATGIEGYRGRMLGSGLEAYPAHQLRVGLRAGLRDSPLRVSFQFRFVGETRAGNTNILANNGPYSLGSYVVADATLSTHEFHPFGRSDTEVALVARNILDAEYVLAGFAGIDYPGAPFSVVLQVRQELSLLQ